MSSKMSNIPKILATVPVYNAVTPEPYISHLILSQECGRAEAEGRYSIRWFVPGPKAKTVVARNHASQLVLSGKADYLLFIDDDMVIYNHKMVERLLAHDVDIVSPIFFRSMPPIEPLCFDVDELGNTMPIMNYPKNSLFETPGGSGTGVMLIKRRVLEAMEVPIWKGTIDPTVGEDVFFCRRARALGFKSWCDSSIKVSQMSVSVPVGEKEFLRSFKAPESKSPFEFVSGLTSPSRMSPGGNHEQTPRNSGCAGEKSA